MMLKKISSIHLIMKEKSQAQYLIKQKHVYNLNALVKDITIL